MARALRNSSHRATDEPFAAIPLCERPVTNSLEWKPNPPLLRLLLALLGVGFMGIGAAILIRFPLLRAARTGAVVTIVVGLAAVVRAARGESSSS